MSRNNQGNSFNGQRGSNPNNFNASQNQRNNPPNNNLSGSFNADQEKNNQGMMGQGMNNNMNGMNGNGQMDGNTMMGQGMNRMMGMQNMSRQQMYNTFLMSTCCELLCNAIWPIIWGIFLFDPFGMKSEPSYDCYANWDDNYATAGVMDIDDSYWTNVSLRFRVIMWIGFVGSLCVTLILMPTKFFYGREYFMQQGPVSLNWREQIATGHQCMSNLAALLFVALAILIFIFRGSHTGFVCSGWYLSSHESMNENIRSVYDVDVGMFLFVLLILNSVMLACMGCACLATCCALTTYQMNRQAFMNPQFNVNMTPDQMNQYQRNQLQMSSMQTDNSTYQ